MFDRFKCFIAKGLSIVLRPPMLTNCAIDKSSKVCEGSHVIRTNIDRYSYVGRDCFVLNADIGAFCSIADGVRIGGAEHPIYRMSTSPVFHIGHNCINKNFTDKIAEIPTKRVSIRNDVWIGANVCIKSGVTIADGAVIGMGAVVTSDIGPYEVWAGVPAKLIKKRFNNEMIERILEIKWWNLSETKLDRIANKVENIEEFIKEATT